MSYNPALSSNEIKNVLLNSSYSNSEFYQRTISGRMLNIGSCLKSGNNFHLELDKAEINFHTKLNEKGTRNITFKSNTGVNIDSILITEPFVFSENQNHKLLDISIIPRIILYYSFGLMIYQKN